MATSPREAHMISYLVDRSDSLKDWEAEFVENLANMEMSETLSEKQRAKLEEIYAKY